MRKVNVIFAAVFAAAILVGGINVFTAVDAVDKKGVGIVDKNGSVDVVGANCVRPFVAKEGTNAVNKNNTDTAGQKNINAVRKGRKIQVDGFLLEWRGADANVWPGSKWLWDAVSTPEGVAGYVSLPVGVNSGNNTRIDTVDGHNINTDKNIGINTDSNAVNNPGIDRAVIAGLTRNLLTDINPGINTIDTAVNNDNSINVSSRPIWVFKFRAVNTGRLLGALEIKLPGQPAGENFAFDKEEFDAGGPLTAEWIIPWDFFDDGAAGDGDAYELSINAVSADGGALRPLVLTVEAPEDPRVPGGFFTRMVMVALIAALTVALVVIRRRQMREKRLI